MLRPWHLSFAQQVGCLWASLPQLGPVRPFPSGWGGGQALYSAWPSPTSQPCLGQGCLSPPGCGLWAPSCLEPPAPPASSLLVISSGSLAAELRRAAYVMLGRPRGGESVPQLSFLILLAQGFLYLHKRLSDTKCISWRCYTGVLFNK